METVSNCYGLIEPIRDFVNQYKEATHTIKYNDGQLDSARCVRSDIPSDDSRIFFNVRCFYGIIYYNI